MQKYIFLCPDSNVAKSYAKCYRSQAGEGVLKHYHTVNVTDAQNGCLRKTLGHGNVDQVAYTDDQRGPRSSDNDLEPHECCIYVLGARLP